MIDFGSYNQGTGDRSIEVVNTTDSDDTGAYRFQTSLGKKATEDIDFGNSGGNFLNALKRLGELEAGIEATASGAITGGLKPYNFYVDTNFKTTSTSTEGTDNFLITSRLGVCQRQLNQAQVIQHLTLQMMG